MKFTKKVAVAINLSSDVEKEFASLRELDFLKDCEVHLINFFLTTTYSYGLSDGALIYPTIDDRKLLEESIVSTLKKKAEAIFPADFTGKVLCHCFFSDSPKKAFSEYIEKEHFDMIIVSSRLKRGLFESSFTQYVSQHTKANLMILKH